jgi:hypothetical protein
LHDLGEHRARRIGDGLRLAASGNGAESNEGDDEAKSGHGSTWIQDRM